MGKIQPGYAMTVAVMATICLIFGMGVSIVSWMISSKAPIQILAGSINSDIESITFHKYWWGGVGFLFPGILGIIAGCTRNSVVMIFFLIFNILGLIASMLMSVFVVLLIVAWSIVNNNINDFWGGCVDVGNNCVCGSLSHGSGATLVGTTCENIMGMQTLLMVLISMGAIATILSFITSYISCYAMCNQDNEQSDVVVHHTFQQGPSYFPQQNTGYLQQNVGYPQQNVGYAQQNDGLAQQNTGYAQAPPPYSGQNYPFQPINSKDNARLVKNQVI